MGAKTGISWTDATWSPLRVRVKGNAAQIAHDKGYTSLVQIAEKMAGRVGPHCERVSHGCDYCYSDSNNGRCLPANGTGLPFDRRSRDLVDPFVDENILMQPSKWRGSRRIFVENQSDLFGEWNTDDMIDTVFAAMALTYFMQWSKKLGNVTKPAHTYQVLTKRVARMREYITRIQQCDWVRDWFDIPIVKHAVRLSRQRGDCLSGNAVDFNLDGISWAITGAESGRGSRPMDENWVRSVRDQCAAAGVAFFYKQKREGRKIIETPELDGVQYVEFPK